MGTGMSEIRAARRKRIQRFAAAQGKCRGFVRLAELAEYRARKDDEVFGVNESRRHDAFVDLGISILKGDFEPEGGGRSKSLCLSEEMPAMRLRADFLVARRIALGGDRAWVSAYLAHCWRRAKTCSDGAKTKELSRRPRGSGHERSLAATNKRRSPGKSRS
jgi:hypothetical protein